MKMKAYIVVDVAPIFVVHAPSLLHHNNVIVIYLGASNLKMEPIRFLPLYFVAMPWSMVTVTEAPFVTTLAHIVVSMKSKP